MKVKRLKNKSLAEEQPDYSNKKVVGPKGNSVVSSVNLKEENDFPLKRFKGTKWNSDELNKTKRKEKFQKSTGVVDFTEESEVKTNETPNRKSNDFMSKLEQFSDVWNDCPTVQNPQENVDSWYSQNRRSSFGNKLNEDYRRTNKKTNSKNQFDGESNNTTISGYTKEKVNIMSTQRLENETNKVKFQEKNPKKLKAGIDAPNGLQGTENHFSNISDLKRKKAVQKHSELHDGQKSIIKQALSSMDGKVRPNKKIVFDDAEGLDEGKIKNGLTSKDKNLCSQKKLFEDDDSDVETDFKLNHQFQGRKGQKLLELQSKFASDSRFAMDTRFYESGSDEGGKSENETEGKGDHEGEKKRQLEILESIVKQPIKPLSEMKRKKAVYSDETYLRFDPTREDHKKYIITQPDTKSEEKDNSEKRKKKKNKKEPEATSAVEVNKTKVTTEKFASVKEDLKEALKKDDCTEFSLLKLFGPKESGESSPRADPSQTPKKLKYGTRNPFKYDSSESEPEDAKEAEPRSKKNAIALNQTKTSWRTTFFFTENDPRLREAFEFLKCAEEPEDNKEYAEKRKVLKDFIRHKFKKNKQKSTLFKKKLGGFKKKTFQKKKGKLS